MATKENSGLGRQNRLRQRIVLAAASWLCFSLGSWVHQLCLHRSVGLRINNEWMEIDPLDAFLEEELRPDIGTEAQSRIRQILAADVHLIKIGSASHASIEEHSYNGIIAEFCALNFTEQKENHVEASTLFQDVVKSSRCGGRNNILRADLSEIAHLARTFDARYGHISNNVPTILDLKGAVFHESRCGAHLSSKALMAINPNKNRVYVHPEPAEAAMKVCGEGYPDCTVTAAANLMRDLVYMMSRSNDHREGDVFFVFRPEATRTMETFRAAFPTTQWIFLCRDPTRAMLSQGKAPAFTMEQSAMVKAYAKKKKYNLEDITDTDMQALQLATFCLSALRNFNDAAGRGLAVPFTKDLGEDLATSIFPIHFHARVDREGERRIEAVDVEEGYAEDGLLPGSEYDAEDDVKDVVKRLLEKPYTLLEGSNFNYKDCKRAARGRDALYCREKDKS